MPSLSELSARQSPSQGQSRLSYSAGPSYEGRGSLALSPSPVRRISQRTNAPTGEEERLQAVVQEIEQLQSELEPLRDQYQQ